MSIILPCESLNGAWETGSHSRARGGCHVSTLFPGRGVTIRILIINNVLRIDEQLNLFPTKIFISSNLVAKKVTLQWNLLQGVPFKSGPSNNTTNSDPWIYNELHWIKAQILEE